MSVIPILPLDEPRGIVAYLDGFDLTPVPFPPSSSLPKGGRSAQDDGKGCLLVGNCSLRFRGGLGRGLLSVLMERIQNGRQDA
jgi:hypothetical protein